MTLAQPRTRFRTQAQRTLQRRSALAMIDSGTEHLYARRVDAWSELADVEALRERAREIRTRTIRDLDRYLDHHTAAMRADFQAHFPTGATVTREVWTLELVLEQE